MAKINLNQEDMEKLTGCINDQTEIPQDLLIKLSPIFFDKLYQEGKFDFQKLDKYKIPTIEYAGKRPESAILAQAILVGEAAPLQVVKAFGNGHSEPWRNMIVQGDNLQFLKTCYLNQDPLIKDKVKGKVQLIYIDPPFATKSDFNASNGEQSYSDKVDRSEFIESLRERVIYLKEILSDNGSIFVHLDSRMLHYIKIILDEIFGRDKFQAEIIFKRTPGHHLSSGLDIMTDTILFYSKGQNFEYNQQYQMLTKEEIEEKFPYIEKETGRRFTHEKLEQSSNAYSRGQIRIIQGKRIISNIGWRWTQETFDQRLKENPYIIFWTEKGRPRYKRYTDEYEGRKIGNLWDDIILISSNSNEAIDYPTQKPEDLLKRIILTSSSKDDLILDCFAGSGTTAAVAEKLGRRWIMCDFGKHAIYTMQKRIWNIAASKKLGQEAKENEKYGQHPQPFSIISAGVYDFSRIMNLRKNKEAYINFVLGLFSIMREEKDYSLKYKLSNIYAEKDNNPVEVYPVWDDEYLKEVRIDEDYLKEIIRATGGRLKGDYYLVTPESCTVITNTTLKNGNNEDINFKLLKFPYKILEDVSRHFQIKDQPASTGDINKLISSAGFYFNEEIEIEIEKMPEGFKIKHFSTGILNQDKEKYKELEGLSMILIDKNYDGQVFNLIQAIYKNEISEEGIVKIEGLTENSYLIAIDKHGNESKVIKI
jgi:DNA modification methylase